MTIATAAPPLQTNDEIATALKRITVKQRRTMDRLDRAPWKWFISDDAWCDRLDRYDREAQRAYFATINRVTSYDGPDYRVRFQNQRSWVRANRMQYEQALAFGMQRSIGVPEIEVTA